MQAGDESFHPVAIIRLTSLRSLLPEPFSSPVFLRGHALVLSAQDTTGCLEEGRETRRSIRSREEVGDVERPVLSCSTNVWKCWNDNYRISCGLLGKYRSGIGFCRLRPKALGVFLRSASEARSPQTWSQHSCPVFLNRPRETIQPGGFPRLCSAADKRSGVNGASSTLERRWREPKQSPPAQFTILMKKKRHVVNTTVMVSETAA